MSSVKVFHTLRRWLSASVWAVLAACGGGGLDSLPVDSENPALVVTFDGGAAGTVTSTPTGIECAADTGNTGQGSGACGATFQVGTAVTLVAKPASGVQFVGWSGDDCTGAGDCTVTLNASKRVTAQFGLVPNSSYTLGLLISGTGNSVGISGAGISDACSTSCQRTFPTGTVITLTPTPAAGWAFSGWTGSGCTGAASCTITMDQARLPTASFVQVFGVSVNLAGSGSVALNSAAGNATCTATCTKQFPSGTNVSLAATPAAGYTFTGWTGACTGAGACSTTVSAARTINATFTPTYKLTLTVAGTGSVAFSSGTTPSCAATCNPTYASGTTVTLTATPGAGQAFSGWSGACTGTGTCTTTLSADRAVTATFAPAFVLSYTQVGSGSVSFATAGGSASCSTFCNQSYATGTAVTLTATPQAGWIFNGWSNGCTGTGTCALTMSAARTATATFVQGFDLSLTIAGSGSVALTGGPARTCTASCTGTYPSGTPVSATATAPAGFTFTGWSGVCSGTAPCTTTMSAARALTATFVQTFNLNLTIAGTGSVSLSGGGNVSSCTVSCVKTYTAATVVTLSATPVAGQTFGGWSGACNGTADCTTTLSAARAVTASFLPAYDFALTISGSGSIAFAAGGNTITCTSACTNSYPSGTAVTLTATPLTGWLFTGWSNGCTGTGTCQATMTAARAVTATFVQAFDLVLTMSGSSGGSVAFTGGAARTCTGTCTGTYATGTVVTATATPAAGYAFIGWSGACGSTGTCTVTMSAARALTANFTAVFDLGLTITGSGSVALGNGAAVTTCAVNCTSSYSSGAVITLTPSPATGWAFSSWGGACSGSAGCNVTMSAAKAVTATFVSSTTVLSVSASGSGSVVSSPAGVNCGATCTASFAQGASVVLTATPAAGSTFSGWSGSGATACTGTGPCTVTLATNAAVTATFRSATLITDQRTIAIPATGSYPAKGTTLVDPVTGFNVTRVADKSELTGDYAGSKSGLAAIVYSRFTPANTTGEFFVVHGDNSTSAWIYRASNNAPVTILRFKPSLGSASRSLGEVNELRWDYTGQHPYRLYFTGRSLPNAQAVGSENVGMTFYYVEFDPVTGVQSNPVVIRDFTADFPGFSNAEIMNDVEGDSSIDSRYWAWQVMNTTLSTGYQPYAVFSYDKTNNAILGRLQRSCAGAATPCTAINTPATAAPYISRPNMVEMSPLGTRVVVDFNRSYSGNFAADVGTVADGPKAFLPNFTDPIRIGSDATHSGWAWGLNGQELFVSQNNRNDWIEAVDITNASTANCKLISDNSWGCGTKIIRQPDIDGGSYTVGFHFGKIYDRTKRGWVYFNTYDSTGYTFWGKNQNMLVQVNDASGGTKSKVVRLGSSYNSYYDYRSEGSGALDFKGENIWTTGNWGYTDGRGDAFKVQLPEGWFGLLP